MLGRAVCADRVFAIRAMEVMRLAKRGRVHGRKLVGAVEDRPGESSAMSARRHLQGTPTLGMLPAHNRDLGAGARAKLRGLPPASRTHHNLS